MIYVFSPVGEATGGTELLQQFCAELRNQNIEAYMYYTEYYLGSPVERKFSYYGNPYVYEINDSAENVLVVPEVGIDNLLGFNNVKKIIWWLSVDNYRGSFPQLRPYDKSNIIKLGRYVKHLPKKWRHRYIFNMCLHFVQSEYAASYLNSIGIPDSKVNSLSDYIDPKFQMPKDNNIVREDVILYNPKKGLGFTQRLISRYSEYKWEALSGLNIEDLVKRLQTAKVYIDFGDHPGKDRIPREAAACGCCVVTSKAGSAFNNKDVSIYDSYKFGDLENPKKIMNCINDCIINYSDRIGDFEKYRNSIRKEKDIFIDEVTGFIELVCK